MSHSLESQVCGADHLQTHEDSKRDNEREETQLATK